MTRLGRSVGLYLIIYCMIMPFGVSGSIQITLIDVGCSSESVGA